MTNRLQGKVALVTGGASGVGLEVVKLLLGEGAKVAFSDINEAVGQQLAAELGERSMFVRHDVSSEADWTLVMAAVQQRLGTLNVLVNNAGILLPGDMETGRLEDFSRLLKINTESVFIGCQQGIAAMKETGGSIINMASISSWLPIEQYAGYSASKAAVSALTRAAALNCRKQGYAIRVNSIHPDGIYTPMMQASLPKDVSKEMILHDPKLNRAGRAYMPERIAQLVMFLASDESSVMSGSELHADNSILGMGL
ncbi:short-chain dehydrogenase [Comamonas testosteroni]|jgi:3(or 17)beta-hydroxysteroid dehydrogenase|uniref:3-beta hydroxysteroid dehydrogenase n=1 Tax=Comamonas testosteroni TaxID=285 RepID=A0A096HKJ3_COMTE|nr:MULTISPECIES: SDR family oxidoreductase [Comamonas]KGH29432.1 3-beta hydroxysteroid dehydrogenase [Comamonas testosteroni]KOC24098.1 short-chain dehydrogenase [Comamonas testosteroni]KWT67610.1 Short-chain dehydrogenase/reductase SDR [Comamonas testosteroni]MDN5506702.1 SDR family oxidoreductase [Comamonas sp.]MDN5537763.1 SDR family oxidoreductase [Comamonas sp.]